MQFIRENSTVLIAGILYTALSGFLIWQDMFYLTLVSLGMMAIYVTVYHLEYAYLGLAFLAPLSINIEEYTDGFGLFIPTEPLLFGMMLLFSMKQLNKGNIVDQRIWKNPIILASCFYLFWTFVTSVTSTNPLASFKFLLAKMWFIIPLLFLGPAVMKKRLNTVGDIVDQMAVQHIVTNVSVDQTIPLKTDISVIDNLTVGIDMFIDTEIPFTAEIPVTEEMLVPFKIGVKDYIRLDTTIRIIDYVNIDVIDTIPLDQKVQLPIFGKRGPWMPIKGMIPLDQQLKVGFSELLPVKSVVPVDLLIVDTLPVGLQMKIPVNVMVPVRIPINQDANICFNAPMPVDGEVPIQMNIPVNIPLEETALSTYFRKLAFGLRGLSDASLNDIDVRDIK